MFTDCDALGGFHEAEADEIGPFVWTQGSFETRLRRGGRFAVLHLCYYGDHGILSVRTPGGLVDQVPLCRGWHTCVARLGDARIGELLEWTVKPVVAVADDSRQLGMMLRSLK